MTSDTSAPVLVTIGFPVGPVSPDPSEVDVPAEIMIGGDSVAMDLSDFFEIWLIAAGQTRGELLQSLREANVADGERRLTQLMQAGLIEEWQPISDHDVQARLRRLRLIPMGVGLGSSPRERTDCMIASPDLTQALAVSAPVYAVWARCVYDYLLLDACTTVAEECGVPLGTIVDHVCRAVPALVAAHFAFVDRP